MQSRKSFTCCLTGEATLLLECAEILLARSVEIRGIISSELPVQRWAMNRHIPCMNSLSEMDWQTESIDYLFNLGGEEIISDEVLQKIFYLTVNLHDALLPDYAGSNAVSWAILNDESWHGITWHAVDALVNGGDLLMQVAIAISPDETAFSLKLKCRQQAINSFPELVSTLAELRYQPVQQNLKRRTSFEPDAKPAANGCVDWHSSAAEIYRLWRATQFGGDRNSFSLPKIMIVDDMFVLGHIQIMQQQSSEEPGTVIDTGDERIIVSTGSNNLRISRLNSAFGTEINLTELVAKYHIQPGYRLASLSLENQLAMSQLSQQCFYHEKTWVRMLTQFQPTPVTLPSHELSFLGLPRSLYYQCLDFAGDAHELPLVLLAAWGVYLHRLENRGSIALWVRMPCVALPPALSTALSTHLAAFFSPCLPLNLDINEQDNFEQIVAKLRETYAFLVGQKTFHCDIWQRYSELRMISPPGHHGYTVDLTPVRHQRAGTGDPLPESFASLFTQLMLYAGTPVGKIDWLNLKEQQVLQNWNATESLFPDHKTIHRLFEEQAHKTPERIALIYEDTQLSYGVLNGQINQLTNYLKSYLGVKPDQLVAVYLERSHLMLVALLGILKAGAAYVPLDPDDTARNTMSILSESGVRVILSSQKMARRFHPDPKAKGETRFIELDSPEIVAKLATQPDSNPRTSMSSRQLAYVRYSLGADTVPNGIGIEHQGIVNQICWMNSAYPLRSSDRILQKASCASDISVWEMFWTVGCGATAVLGCPDRQCELDYFIDLIREKSVTVAQFTSSELKKFPGFRLNNLTRLGNLKHIFCIGEVLDIATVTNVRKLLPDVEIHNLYGPSETAINVLAYDCTDLMEVYIGKPISNIRAYVLDRKLRPMPVGVKGELYISGIGLARGYVNQWRLNENKFMVNPFQGTDDRHGGCYDRLYKTGDMARWLADGNLEFLGQTRAADQ